MTPIRLIKPQLPSLDSVAEYFKLSEDASWFTNFGPCYELLNQRILKITNADSVLIVANATLALELALKTVKQSQGNKTEKKYVITPSYTFAATTTAIRNAGLHPLFVDVDLDDWHASVSDLNELIVSYGDQISCLLLCSTFGTTPQLDKLLGWKRSAIDISVPLLIDCAAGFGANFDHTQNEILVADAVIYSMHATKPFAVGEGGIILGKREIVEACKALSNFGFKNDRTFNEFGTNSKISEIMCATALAALDNYSYQLQTRRNIFSIYSTEFDDDERIKFQAGHENCTWQSLFIQLATENDLLNVKKALSIREIQFRNDWSKPTHLSVSGPIEEKKLPNTLQLSSGALTLPLWIGMNADEVKYITSIVKNSLF